MDKVDNLVNLIAVIASIFFSILNYRFKVASKKSEISAEESKKEKVVKKAGSKNTPLSKLN